LNWYLFVDKQEDEALLGIRNTLYLNLAICLTITGVVLLLTSLTINRYQRRLEDMATTDKLTGLINRQAFELISVQALREAGRSNEPLSAVLVDIDYFKNVNDEYGHFAGDVVIAGVAKAARASLREVDMLCRWGGEEYLVLLKACDTNNAKQLAEKIRAAVEAAVFKYHEISIKVTVSVGVAQYSGNESVEHLLSRADKALYTAKGDGRNRVCIA
jgi:diguanylate cyclase (GGDEF)-like protein